MLFDGFNGVLETSKTRHVLTHWRDRVGKVVSSEDPTAQPPGSKTSHTLPLGPDGSRSIGAGQPGLMHTSVYQWLGTPCGVGQQQNWRAGLCYGP